MFMIFTVSAGFMRTLDNDRRFANPAFVMAVAELTALILTGWLMLHHRISLSKIYLMAFTGRSRWIGDFGR